MKVKCTYCPKKVDMNLISMSRGAYYNNKKEIVCFDCLKKEIDNMIDKKLS